MLSPRGSPLRPLLAALALGAVLAATGLAQTQRTSVLLVLDASGSMFQKLDDGQYRIAAAKDALTTFVTRLPNDDREHGRARGRLPELRVEVGASLDAPAEVAAGAEFTAAWVGPDDAGDYVTIVAAGAPEGAYLSYAYTSRGTLSAATSAAPRPRNRVHNVP